MTLYSRCLLNVEVIPHSEQRYPTIGDWRMSDDGGTRIAVSSLGDWRYEFLIAVHEWIESQLLRNRYEGNRALGGTLSHLTRMVDEFDILFEKMRNDPARIAQVIDDPAYPEEDRAIAGFLLTFPNAEPGDCPASLYYHEHQVATAIERLLASQLGVDWNDYERTLSSLP